MNTPDYRQTRTCQLVSLALCFSYPRTRTHTYAYTHAHTHRASNGVTNSSILSIPTAATVKSSPSRDTTQDTRVYMCVDTCTQPNP